MAQREEETNTNKDFDKAVNKKDYLQIIENSEAEKPSEKLSQNGVEKKVSNTIIPDPSKSIDDTKNINAIRRKLSAFRHSNSFEKDLEFVTAKSSETSESILSPSNKEPESKQKNHNKDNIRNLVFLLDINDKTPKDNDTEGVISTTHSDSYLLQSHKKRKRSSTETSDKLNDNISSKIEENGGKDIPEIKVTIHSDTNEKHVSFQENQSDLSPFDLPEEADILFNRARVSKTSLMRRELKSEHLQRLLEKGLTPTWALGLSKWPELTLNDKQAFADLHRQHARERTELMLAMLDRKMKLDNSEFKAYYNTFVAYCAEHNLEQDGQQAERFMDHLIEKERGRTVRNYLEKEEKVKQPSTEQIITSLIEQPTTNRTRSRSRSRSRSPRRYRPQQGTSPYRGRGRGGRGNQRGSYRGPHRGRRGNFRGQRSSNDGYGRITTSGAFEATNLQEDEAAMILALREARRDMRY